MAVTMASGSTSFGLYTNLRGVEKQPFSFSRVGVVGAFYGFDSVRRFGISHKGRLSSSVITLVPRASAATVEDGSYRETDSIPTPKVIIDQDSDPNATVVEITFGNRLGALLDTVRPFAFLFNDTGRKVEDPELLEAIRLTIINNLIEYHPESSSQLAMGAAFGIEPPPQTVLLLLLIGFLHHLCIYCLCVDVDIATRVNVYDDGPNRSLLYVEAADRPGLLVDLVKMVTDINIAVESGEFDTEGLLAKAKFHVSYRGKAIIKPLQQVLANSLRYFLKRPSTEESSF
ncbi:hypothetical protein RHGRI_035108 [Rhododendron griersonianum]|uniref:ACT domain-containing protein ACR n=1 Tax=Rhododendron griersonianum TaxID=479676 RepID=A0AAV6I3W9_9ERIC|nr:hypothetical protein RHGRI_035108 [Rhododendron griersonianum]